MLKTIQILKINELREGKAKATGNPYRMQDAECVVLDDQGAVAFVGVLMLPKELVGTTKAGKYAAEFDLRANRSTRQIEAMLVSLTPTGAK